MNAVLTRGNFWRKRRVLPCRGTAAVGLRNDLDQIRKIALTQTLLQASIVHLIVAVIAFANIAARGCCIRAVHARACHASAQKKAIRNVIKLFLRRMIVAEQPLCYAPHLSHCSLMGQRRSPSPSVQARRQRIVTCQQKGFGTPTQQPKKVRYVQNGSTTKYGPVSCMCLLSPTWA